MHVCMLCRIGFHAAPIRLHNKGPHSHATQTHVYLPYTVFIEYPLKWIVYAGDQFLFIANFVACRKENFDTLYALHARSMCVWSGLACAIQIEQNKCALQYRHLTFILCYIGTPLIRTAINNFFSSVFVIFLCCCCI